PRRRRSNHRAGFPPEPAKGAKNSCFFAPFGARSDTASRLTHCATTVNFIGLSPNSARMRAERVSGPNFLHVSRFEYADDQPGGVQGAPDRREEEQVSCDAPQSTEAWCVHPRLHDDPEEAELGASEGCARTVDQRFRGDRVHPR